MADELAFPLINGRRHGFASISLKWQLPNGKTIPMYIKSINYSRTRTRGMLRMNHPDPIAKTLGENEYSADVEIPLAELMLLIGELGPGYGDIAFTTLVTYGEDGFTTVTDEILNCTIDSTEVSQSQGPDPLMRKLNLNPTKVLFNGVDDLAVPLAPPT